MMCPNATDPYTPQFCGDRATMGHAIPDTLGHSVEQFRDVRIAVRQDYVTGPTGW